MSLFDTHAHVHVAAFDSDRAAVLERAQSANVRRLINVGYDLASSRASVDLARAYPYIYATAGIQPHYAETTGSDELAELEVLLRLPKVVALGEIGLDYYHDRAPRELQRELLETQLQVAARHKLPVVIHSREAHADTVEVLAQAAHPYGVVMHSFSGDRAYAEACLDFGAYLSFSGPLTFPRSVDLREVAAWTPADRVLVETDCPYLSPHPFRGKRNEPARVGLVAERLAALRGISQDELEALVWRNACLCFSIAEDQGSES